MTTTPTEPDAFPPPDAIGRSLSAAERERFVVEVIRLHAESLMRLARRHSLCADDAHDAYQRGLEIFLRHAHRLDPERAPSWLRTVVKHEAMAVRRSRQRDLGVVEVDFDGIESRTTASPEDQALGADLVARSAEALQRLKPQEVRALWLRAQGNSYEEIQELTGWSRTKVNRCLYEGRRSFLERFAGIEAGEECRRWEPLLSAVVDGEAAPDELLELRPHLRACPACRALVRELHRSSAPLGVLLPAGLVCGAAPEASEHAVGRALETATAWLGERAAASAMRVQLLTASALTSAGKLTAVAAASAAIAGGGMTAVEVARPAAAPDRRPPAAIRTSPSSVPAVAARRPPQPVRDRVVAASVPRPRTARSTPAPEPVTAPVTTPQPSVSAAAELGLEGP